MLTGWQAIGGKWYYFNGNGAMTTGWQKIDGLWYYLYSSGAMASNTTIDGYYLQANGTLDETHQAQKPLDSSAFLYETTDDGVIITGLADEYIATSGKNPSIVVPATINGIAVTSIGLTDCELDSLDVSQCSSLKKLNCSYNHLSSLDLSMCPNLESLVCSFNELTLLNINGCNDLGTLVCTGNYLTSLNVSNCTKLSYLNCNWNKLTSLDVSKCANLQRLECGENNLTSLDVSHNTKLNEDQLFTSGNPFIEAV